VRELMPSFLKTLRRWKSIVRGLRKMPPRGDAPRVVRVVEGVQRPGARAHGPQGSLRLDRVGLLVHLHRRVGQYRVGRNDDRDVTLDPRHDRLTRAMTPLIAAVEGVLAAPQLGQARVRANQVVEVFVVQRRAEGDDLDTPALQHRQRFLDYAAVERRAGTRLQLVRADLDDAWHRRAIIPPKPAARTDGEEARPAASRGCEPWTLPPTERWLPMAAIITPREQSAGGGEALTGTTVSKNDIDTLMELNRDYIHSVQHGDVRRFDEILADDFLCSNPDGSLVDREAFLEQTAKPVTIANLEAHDVNVRLMSDFAIIHARTTYTRPDGQAGAGRYTDVWARRGGRWLAVSAHVTRS
jgi:ketosteroid isomerase-like protein